MDYREAIQAILVAEKEILYGFVATSKGQILCEAGDRSRVPYQGVIDIASRPQSVRAFYRAIKDYEQVGPDFVPRMYAQGPVLGVIHSPMAEILVFAFGVRPGGTTDPTDWRWDFRERVKRAVDSIWERMSTSVDGTARPQNSQMQRTAQGKSKRRR